MDTKALWQSEELLLSVQLPGYGERGLGTRAFAGRQGEQLPSEPQDIESCTPASESW